MDRSFCPALISADSNYPLSNTFPLFAMEDIQEQHSKEMLEFFEEFMAKPPVYVKSMPLEERMQKLFRLAYFDPANEMKYILPDPMDDKDVMRGRKFAKQAMKKKARGRRDDPLANIMISVSLLEPDTAQFYYVVGLRSDILFKNKQFVESLVDLNRASNSEKCVGEAERALLERKAECIREIQNQREARAAEFRRIEGAQIEENEKRELLWRMQHVDKQYEWNENMDCMNFDNLFPLPDVDLSRNEWLPNASEKIKLIKGENNERRLVATQKIEPGEVLIIEDPYVTVLKDSCQLTHCSNCLVRTATLIPCFYCRHIMFCNPKCRNEAWEQYHKIECRFLIILFRNEVSFSDDELLCLRMFLIATKLGKELKALMEHEVYGKLMSDKSFQENTRFCNTDYYNIHNLEDRLENRTNGLWDVVTKTAAHMIHIFKMISFFDEFQESTSFTVLTDLEEFAGCLLVKLMLCAQASSHTLTESIQRNTPFSILFFGPCMIDIGKGIYPLIRTMRHSCDANTFRVMHKKTSVVRAAHPINKGDELFDDWGMSYVNCAKRTRLIELAPTFLKCKCKACKRNYPPFEFLPTVDPRYRVTPHDRIILNDLANEYREIKRIQGGYSDHYLQFMYRYLVILYRNFRKPWKRIAEVERDIRQTLMHRSNFYSALDELIVENGILVEPDFPCI